MRDCLLARASSQQDRPFRYLTFSISLLTWFYDIGYMNSFWSSTLTFPCITEYGVHSSNDWCFFSICRTDDMLLGSRDKFSMSPFFPFPSLAGHVSCQRVNSLCDPGRFPASIDIFLRLRNGPWKTRLASNMACPFIRKMFFFPLSLFLFLSFFFSSNSTLGLHEFWRYPIVKL